MNRKFALVLAALTAAFAVPSSAYGAVTCVHAANGPVTISVTAPSTTVHLLRNGNNIEVRDALPPSATINCGVQPTVNDTSAINVTDAGGNHDLTTIVSHEGGLFAPGFGGDTATGEVEISIDGVDGASDRLDVIGTSGSDTFEFGKTGANIGGNVNNDVDVDDVLFANGDQLRVNGSGGSDTLDLDGRPATGHTGPVDYPSFGTSILQLDGGANDDTLIGGSGGWNIDGEAGNDTQTGGAGVDEIVVGDTGNDTANGADGTGDFVNYQGATGGVRVDLGISATQNTATAGNDTLSGFENIVGSQDPNAGDTLIGDSGTNTINANAGADTLIGRGGDDTLNGGPDPDTASYASGSTGPVTASLATNTTSGGAGADTLSDIQNLTGSPFSDTLTGDGNGNRIDVYDGILDTVNCGAGTDTTITDELGVDTLNANCEPANRDSAPKVSVGSPPADGATTNDPTPAYPLSADEGASFQVSVDGGGFQNCAASCEPSSLSDGAHTLTFRAVDTDENQHPGLNPASRSVTVDATAPAVQITGPTGTTPDTTPTFTYSASEASTFECQVDGTGFGPCSGPDASHTTGALANGPHSFDVRATDAAGNQGTATAAFVVDTSSAADTDPPETKLKKPRVKGDDVKIRFSSDEPGTTFRCKLDKKKPKPCTSPKKYKNLDEGKHKVTVVGTDAAGNTDPSAAKKKFVI